jgi:hypothetical protein
MSFMILDFNTSCIFLGFDHEYFYVGDTFISVLHMFDVFCEVVQESFCQFVTKRARKFGSTTTVYHVYPTFWLSLDLLGFITKLLNEEFVNFFC